MDCRSWLYVIKTHVVDCMFMCRRWRFSQICIRLLSLLVRFDVAPPTCLVKMFTQNLIHDSLAIRKVRLTTNDDATMTIYSRNVIFRSPLAFKTIILKRRAWSFRFTVNLEDIVHFVHRCCLRLAFVSCRSLFLRWGQF